MAHANGPVKFAKVRDADQVATVVALADVIWREHYTPIIGKAQVDYMLTHIHSGQTIRRELDEGALYYLVLTEDEPVGYFCVRPEASKLFLSKIYVLSSRRGTGIGKLAMERIQKVAVERGLDAIRLTVNRNNSDAIAAYRNWGFEVTGEVCADIGGGFVMDDYAMELRLDPQA